MIHLAKFILIILLLGGSNLVAFVHASGDSIVDADGNVVLKRGMGLGGWLVPEGYMLHVPGFGSPTAIRAMIVDLVGESLADSFYQAYHDNYVTREDILQLGAWGFDHIRMPFHYKMFSPYRDVWDEWGFQVTDSLLAWCAEAGMHLVLDMHAAPGGQNHGPISDSDGTARLWLADSNKAHAIAIWGELARRYADNVWIGGYDLLNEPVLPTGVGTGALRALYMNMTQAIRAEDDNHILFIEGNWYASDFTGLTPPWELNMSYSFHKYWSVNNQGSIQSYLNMRNSYDVPLWMSESGENSNPWFHDCVQLLEGNDIGWCWWTHKKYETITSPYSAALPSQFDQLVDYWNGSAPRPDTAFAFSVIMEMAENLRTENCTYRPGVIPSLFHPQFPTSHWPVKELQIPGEIWTADYDIGDQGIAYSDADWEHDDYNDYHPWNTGYAYRNDGVDLEMDDAGVPSVGWINDGEWLKYTVNVTLNGFYDLSLEIASPDGNGNIRIYLDAELVATLSSLPNTGSWYEWDTVELEDIEILAGTYVLTVEIVQAGFNMRIMNFDLDSSLTEIKYPNTFQLGQNRPNPFNSGTQIPITVQNSHGLQLEIFDIRGHRVDNRRIPDGSQGELMINWDGHALDGRILPTGLYIYRVLSDTDIQVQRMALIR